MPSKTSKSSTPAFVTEGEFALTANAFKELSIRYGKDLAYFLKRMDEIEKASRKHGERLCDVVLWLSSLSRDVRGLTQAVPPKTQAAAKAERRGNCRIIRFGKMA